MRKKEESQISVIMPVYNENLIDIDMAIESILNQTFSSFELIIIDDSPSRDDLKELLVQKMAKDRRVHIFINEKNIGLTESLNKAVSIATGQYIARMDADDISLPERLYKQLDYLTKHKLDLVGCNVVNIDQIGNTIPVETFFPEKHDDIVEFLRIASPMPHPTWFGKKDVFKDNKYIDYLACEDYELLTRIVIKGYRLGNIVEPLLKYRNNPSSISNSKKSIQKVGLSFVRKNYRKNELSNYAKYIAYTKKRTYKKRINALDAYYKAIKKLKNGHSIIGLFRIGSLSTKRIVIESLFYSIKLRKLKNRILKQKRRVSHEK